MTRHAERLRVPVSWWFSPVFFLIVIPIGMHAYRGPVPAVVTAAAMTLLAVAGLLQYGSLQVVVDDAGLRAGPHRLERRALGPAWPLEPDQAWALRGPRADTRARLVLRGYVRTAVRVDVVDPGDPSPYWYVSTRKPHELAAALNTLRAQGYPGGGPR